MQMYAFALRTSSIVVRRTIVSLMYAHWRWCDCCGRGGSDAWLERDSFDDREGVAGLSDSATGGDGGAGVEEGVGAAGGCGTMVFCGSAVYAT